MLNFIFFVIITILIMSFGLFIGIFSKWDWLVFFTIDMIISRLFVIVHHCIFRNFAERIIAKINEIDKHLFSEDIITMLRAAPCIILQPVISPYKITFFNPFF